MQREVSETQSPWCKDPRSQFEEGPMTPFDESFHFSGLSFVHTVKDGLPPASAAHRRGKRRVEEGWVRGAGGWVRSHYVSVFVS